MHRSECREHSAFLLYAHRVVLDEHVGLEEKTIRGIGDFAPRYVLCLTRNRSPKKEGSWYLLDGGWLAAGSPSPSFVAWEGTTITYFWRLSLASSPLVSAFPLNGLVDHNLYPHLFFHLCFPNCRLKISQCPLAPLATHAWHPLWILVLIPFSHKCNPATHWRPTLDSCIRLSHCPPVCAQSDQLPSPILRLDRRHHHRSHPILSLPPLASATLIHPISPNPSLLFRF